MKMKILNLLRKRKRAQKSNQKQQQQTTAISQITLQLLPKQETPPAAATDIANPCAFAFKRDVEFVDLAEEEQLLVEEVVDGCTESAESLLVQEEEVKEQEDQAQISESSTSNESKDVDEPKGLDDKELEEKELDSTLNQSILTWNSSSLTKDDDDDDSKPPSGIFVYPLSVVGLLTFFALCSSSVYTYLLLSERIYNASDIHIYDDHGSGVPNSSAHLPNSVPDHSHYYGRQFIPGLLSTGFALGRGYSVYAVCCLLFYGSLFVVAYATFRDTVRRERRLLSTAHEMSFS
ncbi:hypothetical protein BZA70DRAFT_270592 [Myxozyma melibiosi]|uniref:Uncharacterized protein n=1 Tax=Myxozyma melibiosi TaxID=54550 RepID=A0ABR1FBB8_9ASCO